MLVVLVVLVVLMIGAWLGAQFKVWILVPAALLSIIVTSVGAVTMGKTVIWAIAWLAAGNITLQLGFAIGWALSTAVFSSAKRAGLRRHFN